MRKFYTLLSASVLLISLSFYSGKVLAQCTTTITAFPFNESFENSFGTLWTGDIVASGAANIPGWQTENNGVGNSANTGPTNAQDGTVYAYTEATNGTTGQIWNLNSPCFTIPLNSAPYISFYHHMLTNVVNDVVAMGYLYLDVNTNPSGVANWTTIWQDSGSNGDVWIQNFVDLDAYAGQTIQLRFQGVRGNSFQGDRAIDNILVSTGVEASNSYCTSGSHATATASAIFGSGPYTYNWSTGQSTPSISGLAPGSYSVTITDAVATSKIVDYDVLAGAIPVIPSTSYAQGWESGIGSWYNDSVNDDFDWSVNSGGTPTGPTGPTGASEGSNYIYTEASFLNNFDEAILNSPCFDIVGEELPYLKFDYNMRVQGGGGNASDMGILWLIADITPQTLGDADTLWTQVGASGAAWLSDSVDLSAYDGNHVTIRFIGQLSNGTQQYGDRAVDNIRIESGVKIIDACAGTPSGSITLDPQFGSGAYTYSWNTGSSSNPYASLNPGTYTVTITNTSAPSQVHTYTVGTQIIPTPTGVSATLGSYCENNIQSTTLSINLIAGNATFNGTSATSNDLGPNGTIGQNVNYSIGSTPPFATGPGTIIFNYRGDVEAPGEFINVLSETGTQIGVANVPTTQCNANFVQESFAVSVDTITAWASNNSIDFVGSPFGMTRYCGNGGTRYSQEGQVTISYPYSTTTPYWFANSCDNVIANAVDSGFVVTVSPAVTTTYFVRYYNTLCNSWGASCESITITVNPKPTVTVTPPNPSFCSTPTVLTASGASTYAWSPGTGLNTSSGAAVSASPSSTTNYQVIGTDANTCSDTTNITVTVTAGPSVSISSTNPTCNAGVNGTATAIASGGTGAYTYAWSNGATSAAITGLSAGIYTVTVNDGTTCTATQSVVISDPAPLSITIAGNNIGCSGFNSGSAFAFVTGGTPLYTYAWSNGATTNVAFALAAGTYTVTVTDANGCSGSQSVTITQPSSPLTASVTSSSNVSCFGGNDGSATAAGAGGTPAYSYAWSSGANTATASNLTAGTYVCTVSDINGCVSVAIATITQPATAVTVSVTGSTNVTCNGGNDGSATAFGSGGTGAITYLWSNGATTATATGLTAGTYTVTATDANLCTATDNITITEPTPVTATFASTNVSCFGGNDGTIAATGSGGNGGAYTYLWSTGATSASISGLTAGTYSVTITDNAGCTGIETQAITEPTLLVAAIALGNNVLCNGGNTGSATASATGGTTAYSFAWSNGATTAAVTGLAAGTYTVTVTDANLCTDTETITITEPTPVVAATALNNNVSCFGGYDGSATASATGGTGPYTFAWSNGGTTATVTNLTAGTFTVTATDANLCTDTETITITQPATAVTAAIALGNNVSCSGGIDGTATASAPGGTAPYNFAWSNGTTTASATGLAAGTYTVTATDANGCDDTETITITEPTPLVAAIALGSNVLCNGNNDGSATASATGGTAPYTFAWSNGATTANATGLAAGTYTVTVTDANLCDDTETITITEPTLLVAAIALGNNVLCNGGNTGSATASATGGTSPYTFAWSNGATTANVTGLAAGTYTVTVTDANLCTDTETITITEPTPVVAATALNNNVSCFGGNDGSATASATGGTGPYSFAWSNGGTTATVSNLTAGTFTVTATDANLCTDTETITITQPATAVTAAIALGNNVSCSGGIDGAATASATGGTAPYTFLWSNGAATANATGLAAGTYTVTVTDANLCTDTETITITEPTPLVAAIALGSNVLCNGNNDGSATASATGGTAPYTFAWSNGATTTNATGLAAGTYIVTVTDANLCTDTETITITEPTVLVASIALGNNVLCNGGNDGSITASATGGTTAYSFAWSNGATTATASSLAAGTYTVTVTDANLCMDTETITITEPTPVLAATALNNNVSCFGGNDGSATASATGGTGPYSFAWSNGGNTATVTNLTAGTFTVTATDANLCSDAETITITQPATAVTASIALGNNVSCNGGIDGSATASATGGTSPYTFLWSNGATTANATGLAAGTYTVTATDANLCTDTETITITEPIPLVAAIALGSNVSCFGGNDGSVTASATGGTVPYTFAWSNGAATATVTSLTAGTYTVTVTDANLCDDTETITITEPGVLVASIALGNNVLCNGGNDGSATASATGGTTAYSFAWSNGATTATASNLTTGTYTVTVTDVNLCTDTETITITEPTPLVASILSSSNISCFGLFDGSATAAAAGGTAPYTYAWSFGGSTAAATGLGAGTYIVTVTDANLCTDTSSVTISQPALLIASTALINNASCNGGNDGSASVSGIGGTLPYTYAWPLGDTTSTVTNLSVGTHIATVTDASGCADTSSVTITEPNILIASTSMTQAVSCASGNDGSAAVSATGGTTAYSFAWSNGDLTAIATNLSAGTYTVTVTDANGCSDTASVTITEPLPITLVTTTSNVLCFGAANGTASVVASGGIAPYTYLWATGNTLSTATNLSPGTYGITVTDANGCAENSSVTITQPTQLIATAVVDSNVSCNSGNNGQASASGVGGTAPYAYSWSNGDLDSIAENLMAGSYTVTITDFNGCTSNSTITITEPTPLVLSGTVANNVSCFSGIDGSASVNATGGTSPYSYLWSNGSTNTNLTNLAAGTYTISATDANGCTDTASITITEPALLIASTAVTTNVSCNGGNDGAASALGVGGTTPYTYAWSNGATTSSITGLSAGTYTLTITDANGCTDDEPVTITEPTPISVSTVLVNNVSCNGGSDGVATIFGSGGSAPYSFAWSNGSTNAVAAGLSAGTYIVTLTDFNGCTDTASITITEPASLIASASSLNNALCSGSNTGTALASAVGGTAPFTYSWSNATTMDTAINLAAGTYNVTITDANGCFDSASVTIIAPSAVVANAILISDAACNGTSTGSAEGDPTGGTTPYTYAWSTGSTNDTISNLTAGSYFLTVTDANGCTGLDTVVISEPAALVIAVDSITDASCNGGNDGAIATITSGGTAPYTYIWSNSAVTANITGLSAGSYTVTVTDANGCNAAINPIVQEPSVLNSSIFVSDVNCNGGNDGYAIASGNGGISPYSYAWSTGSAIDSTGGLSIGSYIVTITDDNGCFTIDTAVISEPTSLIASIVSTDSVNCAGDSTGSAIAGAVGGTSPYLYSWPAAVGSANDSLLSSIPAGTYTVTITDANGCIDSAVATVNEYPVIALTIDSALDVTCAGGNDGYASVIASGGAAGYTYLWSNGATGISTDSLMGGTQCVTVTDANGCSETICTALNETFSLPVVDLGNDTLLCDTIFTITSSSAVSYAWNTLENTQSIDVQTSGTYTVTVTDSNGCENSNDIVVNFNPYLDFDIDTDSTLCASATGSASIINLTGGGGYAVTWSNGQIGGTTASNLGYGSYSVDITDANGCQASKSFFIYNDTDLEFALNATDVSCFGANDGQATVAILDGTAPFSYNWSNGATNDTVTNLMSGTYAVTVSDSNGCEVIDSVTINQPDQVIYNIASLDADCGSSNGYAAVVNISPAGAYTYAWNDPLLQTTDTASALAAGVYQVVVTAANGCSDSSIAIISNNNAPTLAMSAIDETCEGSENGSAIVAATSISPLTYMWSDAMMQTTDTASALGAGLYFVTVTDTFGCIGIDTVTVNTLSPLPMPNLGPDSLVCESNYDLTPGAGFTTYLWSDGSNSDTLNITTSGIYSVTVSNAGGCENVDSVNITLSTPITFTSTINNSSCSQNTGSVTLVASGGTGTIGYAWSTGDTIAGIANVGAGNYLVTISDSVGCSVEADFDVDNINAPVLAITTIDLSCFGDNSGAASSTVTGGTAPFTYTWSNGSIGSSVNGLAAGNYDLTIVDDSGCVVIEPFTITEPNEINISISFVQPACGDSNGSALATVTNTQGPISTYLWDDLLSTTTANLDTIPAGFYTVSVTDSAGCEASQGVAISNFGAAILATTATDNNCSNENTAFATVAAIGGAPFTFEWNDGLAQTGDTAFNLFNGIYAVSVIDTAGCIAIDVVNVGSTFDAPTLNLGNDVNACIGAEVILTAGGGYASYSWNTGASTPSIVAALSQAYDLTVSNTAGCFASDTINVQFVTQPIVDLGPDTIVCIDDFNPTITLDAGEGFNFYEWSTNDTTQTIDVSTGGAYTVSVSEFVGCFGSDQVIVVFDTCVNVTVDNILNASGPSIAIYPNPNRGLFTIESKGLPLGDYQIKIMNASGQSIINKQIRITGSASNLTEIDVQSKARGLYMMILEGESIRMDQRVIIQ